MSKPKPARLSGVICRGDCLEILPTLDAGSVDLILTDPPYGIDYRSNRRTKRPKFDYIQGDAPGDWIERFAREAYRTLRNNRHLYCFCRHDTFPRFFTAFRDAGFTMKRTLIWIKNNHGSGDLKGDYAPKDEWIIFAQKGRRLLNGRRSVNILQGYDKVATARRHPTEKPIALLKFLIEKSTNPGELVLDPYAGVMTTALATMDLGRNFQVVELNPDWQSIGRDEISRHPNLLDYLIHN